MQKIVPFLWYSKEAEEAATFYTSIFPDSRVTRVTALPSDSPSGPPGSVKVVEFVLCGQPFMEEMMADPDRAKAKRASDAMMKMVKLDIAALKKAYAGAEKATASAKTR